MYNIINLWMDNMVISVAGLNIDINLIYENKFISLNDYKINEKPNYFINSSFNEFNEQLNEPFIKTKFYDQFKINNKIIQKQKKDDKYYATIEYLPNGVNIYNDLNNKFIDEYLLSQYAINYLICNNTNSILFHSSTIYYNNLGIAFSAKSGTGKSTQRRLWEKYSDARVINDDKNFITLKDDKLYISPNPWCGKHFKQNNINSTLNVIIFLYQNKINEINILPKAKAFRLLLGQILQPSNDNIDKWNKIVDKLLELPIYHFGCNMEQEAFKLLNERILKDVK